MIDCEEARKRIVSRTHTSDKTVENVKETQITATHIRDYLHGIRLESN